MANMGEAPDYRRLAAEVLGIRNAPQGLARRLVSQALVVEDRRDAWRKVGTEVCAAAPSTPGVYVVRDEQGRAVYVGKANNLRRRLGAHFSERRWRVLKPEFARAAAVEWIEVGSELEALIREAALIDELQPSVNVQIGPPHLSTRGLPRALVRDVIVLVPSTEPASIEIVAARLDGGWMIQRTRRSGDDLRAQTSRLMRFFHLPLPRSFAAAPLAPIVFSWLARRGAHATRLDPHDAPSAKELRARLLTLVADEALFTERIVVR
jgi:predicted GIY-YIG superfamily endonuclease